MEPGRPSLLTPAVHEAVCKIVSSTRSCAVAAKAVGVSEDALRKWKQRGRRDRDEGKETIYSKFLIDIDKAFACKVSYLVGLVDTAAETDYRAAVWLLERAMWQEFSKSARPEVTIEGDTHDQKISSIIKLVAENKLSAQEGQTLSSIMQREKEISLGDEFKSSMENLKQDIFKKLNISGDIPDNNGKNIGDA